jgi:aldose sugar dehydrogenase
VTIGLRLVRHHWVMIAHPGSHQFRLAGAISGLLVAMVPACTGGDDTPAPPSGAGGTPVPEETTSTRLTWHVHPVMTGLDHPWDAEFLPDGSMLVTERDVKRILLRTPDGRVRVAADDPPGIWVGGETGLMSIAIDPNFSRNRRFYTCQGNNADTYTGHDVRVTSWRLNRSDTHAFRTGVIVKGLPSTSGRHGGCRLKIGPGGALYIGTGDAATGTNPQDLTSLGGKVLRVNRFTGNATPSNPFASSSNPNTRLIYTYGHRNVQGLAFRPNDVMWSVEHGPDRDDEINRLVAGGNYGWNPVPGYNESVPMTDFALPGPQVGARWSSGFPTDATSGAAWLSNPRWDGLRGMLAVASLKDSSLRLMHFDQDNKLLKVLIPKALDGTYGRLRSVTQGPAGALFITTDNSSIDKVLRVWVTH